MSSSMFHLGWFLGGASPHAWNAPWSGDVGREWNTLELTIDLAKAIERAGFDYLLIEDSSHVPGGYEGSHDVFVQRGLTSPKLDPAPVAAILGTMTKRLGIVTTLATSEYPPYLLARLTSTLDQLSNGRTGWNLVTGGADQAAQNYGAEALPAHDLRYEMADEFVKLVKSLWDSWEPDSIVGTPGGDFADPSKVHVVDFQGKYYSSRGPLQSGPAVQGHPVITQAGGSERGRTFAATHAESIVAAPKSVEAMVAYRADVKRRMVDLGRDPDSCKVLYTIYPVFGETQREAEEKARRLAEPTPEAIEKALALMAKKTDIDFGKFDLDAPVEDLHTNAHQSTLADFLNVPEGTTLREIAARNSGGVPMVGTPSYVAGRMAELMQEAQGDGYLLSGTPTRRFISEVTDGLVPELRKLGVVREEYTGQTLRENLLAF